MAGRSRGGGKSHTPVFRGGGGGAVHPAAALMEERIIGQHREIQALLLENQRLAATHVALKQELVAYQQQLRHISATASDVKAERDAQVREVYERSLKVEAEARSMNAANAELIQAKADTQKLNSVQMELLKELQTINTDVARAHTELERAPAVKAEIDDLHLEIQKGRAAIENEKKTRAENLQHEQAMEKIMVVMAHELEKLRAELANAEKRARAAAAAAAAASPELANAEKRARAAAAAAAAASPGPGGAGSYRSTESGYGGNSHGETYGIHQVQGGSDGGSQYGSAAVPLVPYDMHDEELR